MNGTKRTAWEALNEYRTMSWFVFIGPLRTHTITLRYGWVIVAEEISLSGGDLTWDVSLRLEGARVPAGPNLHHDPAPEIARLDRVLDS